MGVGENVGCNVGENTGSSGGSRSTFEPAKHLTFENYAPGASAESASDPGLFNYLAGATTISTEVTPTSGTNCARFFKQGIPGEAEESHGFGNWGGEITLPQPIAEGEELWCSWLSYWPDGFLYRAGPGHLKYCRVRRSGGQYIDLAIIDESNSTYCPDGLSPKPAFKIGAEGGFGLTCVGDYDTDSPTNNQGRWVRHEWYIKASSGSGGLQRFWADGDLLGSFSGANMNAGETLVNFMFHTYWNSTAGLPADEPDYPVNDSVSYVDNIVIATSDSPPTETDVSGNAVIGSYTG